MRLLLAGIGNIFRGDDAFGCEVAQQLARRPQPDGVTVRDFGIRGFDLATALMDGYDGAILIDATARGHTPGTLYLIEPGPDHEAGMVNPHSLTPEHVFQLVTTLGGRLPWIRVLGCEPENIGSEEEGAMGLSDSVQASIEAAVNMTEQLARDFLSRTPE